MDKNWESIDQREYSRISVEVGATFFVKDGENLVTEFTGKIIDISEKGLRVEIDSEKYKENLSQIKENHIIEYQAVDKFNLFGKNTTEVFSGKVEVVHSTHKAKSFIIGCKLIFSTKEFEKYVMDKRISIYYIEI